MQLYVETSCLFSWLLNEPSAPRVIDAINRAEVVVTSRLTLIGCERGLRTALAEKKLKGADFQKLISRLYKEVESWVVVEISSEIAKRAGQSFPFEPARTLDAIHLAAMLELLQVYPELQIITFDDRVLKNLEPVGLTTVLP